MAPPQWTPAPALTRLVSATPQLLVDAFQEYEGTKDFGGDEEYINDAILSSPALQPSEVVMRNGGSYSRQGAGGGTQQHTSNCVRI